MINGDNPENAPDLRGRGRRPVISNVGLKQENEMNKITTVTHVLEIRIGSMRNDPVCQLESSTPFGAMSVGDKFEHGGIYHEAWHDLPKEGEVYFIIEKSHIISQLGSGQILHSIVLCLKARPY